MCFNLNYKTAIFMLSHFCKMSQKVWKNKRFIDFFRRKITIRRLFL